MSHTGETTSSNGKQEGFGQIGKHASVGWTQDHVSTSYQGSWSRPNSVDILTGNYSHLIHDTFGWQVCMIVFSRIFARHWVTPPILSAFDRKQEREGRERERESLWPLWPHATPKLAFCQNLWEPPMFWVRHNKTLIQWIFTLTVLSACLQANFQYCQSLSPRATLVPSASSIMAGYPSSIGDLAKKHPAKQPSMNAGKIFWQLKINSLTIMINSCYPLSICGNSKPKEFQSLIKHNWGPWWSTNRPGIFQSSCAPAKHGTCQVGKSIAAAIPASSNDLWGYCYTMWENWASLSWLYPS